MTNFFLSASIALAAAPTADVPSPKEAPVVRHAPSLGVGRMLADAKGKDTTGNDVSVSSALGRNGLVLAMTSTTCPVSKKYGPSWAAFETELAKKGINVLYVNATTTDSAASIDAFVKSNNLKGRYVHDAAFAKAVGASTTAEVFLVDAKRTIVYRGAADDQYGLGYQLPAPKVNFLLDAATALTAGRTVAPAATTAPGCELDFGKTVVAATSAVTYHNRISRIVQANCLDCHREGGAGPFKMDTPEDLTSHAGMIRKVVNGGTMPPWFATAPAPGTHTPWSNDRRLPDADKADLLAWLNGDRAVGNPADAPLAKTYPDGWNIGKPDQVFQIPRKFAIQANGQMPYQNVTFDSGVTEDKWVKAVEVRPTSIAVVHHVLVFLINQGDDPAADPGQDERRGFFAAYVPGNGSLSYPDGYAKKLPKGSKFRIQIHYTPNGTATTDQLKIGVVYADKTPRYEVKVSGIANPMMRVPPGAAHHEQKAVIPVADDVDVIGFLPHMHVRGSAARYEIKGPDGKVSMPLDVPHYDFNWQLHYKLAEPMRVKKGSTFTFTAWFDNSTGNPANPDPKKWVRWGPQTSDEMLLGYVEYIVPAGSDAAKGHGPLHAIGFDRDAIFKEVNVSGTGKITFDEFAAFVKPLSPRLREPLVLKLAFERLDKNKDGLIDKEEFVTQFMNRK